MATLVPQDSFILENKNPEQMVIALIRAAELLIMGGKSVARGGITINIDQNGDVSIDSNLVLENGNQPGKPLGEEGAQYALRNPIDLDRAGGYYVRHVCAMTREGLHLKSKIAAELAWRDMEIDRLKAELVSAPVVLPEPVAAKADPIDALRWGANVAETLLSIGRAIGFGRAQQILGEQWEADHNCAPRGRMGVTVKDDAHHASTLLPEPAVWTLQSELDAKRTTTNGHLWFSNPVNALWTALFTEQQVRALLATATGLPAQAKDIAELVTGMSVSVDVSTGDDDAGNRYFGTVTLAQEDNDGKHGLILLVQDAEPNFAPQVQAEARDAIRELIAIHSSELEQNEYAYFELAHTRQTGWCAWITDHPRSMPPMPTVNPDRKVIASGQGDTPEEACSAAIAAAKGE